jgi:hypothetical protein
MHAYSLSHDTHILAHPREQLIAQFGPGSARFSLSQQLTQHVDASTAFARRVRDENMVKLSRLLVQETQQLSEDLVAFLNDRLNQGTAEELRMCVNTPDNNVTDVHASARKLKFLNALVGMTMS